MDNLTPPQQSIVDYLVKHNKIDRTEFKARGLDVRAANNLVQARVLTVTNGIYRLDARYAAKRAAAESRSSPKTRESAKAVNARSLVASSANDTESAKEEIMTEQTEIAHEEIRPEAAAPPAEEKPVAKPKAAEEKPAPKAARPVKNVELRPCLCGCGAATKGRFLAGHDAKLHSLVLRIWRGKARKDELPTTERTLAYLQGAPWMTDEIRAAVGI